MITGAHVVIYTTNAEADREFFRDVLGMPHVDAGHGWLIFGLPPAEAALHPSEKNDACEFYLMCGDLQSQMAEFRKKGVQFSDVEEARWGSVTRLRLPGGGNIGLYQPRHATALGL